MSTPSSTAWTHHQHTPPHPLHHHPIPDVPPLPPRPIVCCFSFTIEGNPWKNPTLKVVIDHGAVPIFVKLLSSQSDDVREQAVWALGNMAGDSPKCRDLVLANGALIPLLSQLNEHAKLSMLRNATWTLSNFCRGKPQPALPALERLIHSNDEEVLTNACWVLSYLSDGTNDKIQAVIEAGVYPRLVEFLSHPSPSVLIPPFVRLET